MKCGSKRVDSFGRPAVRDRIVVTALTSVVVGVTTIGVGVEQPPTDALAIAAVKDGLYVITGSGGNVAARVAPNGVVLVDNAFERNHAEIVRLITEVTDAPITHVIGTHHHGDHMGGNPPFSTHATVIAHANARTNMLADSQPTPPGVVFNQTTSLFSGDIELKAHYFGAGHTNGDTVVEFPDLHTVHTGDLVVGSIPFIDYPNGGNSEAWVGTLGRILELDFDTVVPGHGPIMTKADVRVFRDALVTLRARMSQLVDRGVPKEDVANHLYTEDLGWPLSRDGLFVSRSVSGFYDEMAEGQTP